MLSQNEDPEQEWFWDHHFLRNRKEPFKVLTVSVNITDSDTGATTGYLKLHDIVHGRRSQQFELEGREIVCKDFDLRISFIPSTLAVVCVDPDRSKEAHPWIITPGIDINSYLY